MEEIRQWIDEQTPNFDGGFALFCKYSRNQSLMSYIGRKRDMAMLKYELNKLLQMKVKAPNPHYKAQHTQFARIVEKQPEKVLIVDQRKVNREDLPEEMQKVYDLNVNHYKDMRSLHEKMKQANSDKGRLEFREQIVILEGKIKQNWSIIDSGKFLEDKTSSSANINSARAYISKMMKKDDLTPQQRELIKEKLNIIITSGELLKPETLQKLKEKGF